MPPDDYLVEILASLVKTGRSIAEARDTLLAGGRGVAPAEVAAAVRRYEDLIQRVRVMREPTGMYSRQPRDDWYPGPSENDPCWPRLHRYLLTEKKWPSDVVDSVDRASTRIVSLLSAPGRPEFSTRGLVLGYVQSGKTANFTAVISKAADAGYKLFIVLSGLHNGLRRQTQHRLEAELSQLKPDHWLMLTSEDEDFRPPAGNATAFLSDNANQRVLCVMKKNGSRLRALLRWLKKCDRTLLANTPMLMIDDEADQASIDTSGTDDPSTINRLLLEVLRSFKKGAYVAYTATPFANVLSDPRTADLLYPRDFIVDLPRPTSYFGAERIFGLGGDAGVDGDGSEGLDMIRDVPDEDVEQVQPPSREGRAEFEPSIPPTLDEALDWFLLACAIRRVRGHSDKHMSMLVHTTLFTDVHAKFEDLFLDRIELYLSQWQGGHAELRERLRVCFADETARVPAASLGESPVTFDEAWSELGAVLEAARVIIDNGKSESRLEYPSDGGSTRIVVGGNTLSRGLTIEGLMVSYFVRTSTLYDALLQMGRWFGYRVGYSDLPRIWMTPELADNFVHLAIVESELRADVARYERENLTPLDFAPRIQTHSSLAITCPLKMRYAVDTAVSFAGSVKQTTYFNHRNLGWLENNIEAAHEFVARVDTLRSPKLVWGRHRLWRDVDVATILDFLGRYQIHETHADMAPSLLTSYIGAQNDEQQLLRWNVAIVGQSRGTGGTWDGLLPGSESVPLLVRARMKGSSPANLKAIMSLPDRGIDLLDEPPSDMRNLVKSLEQKRSVKGALPDPAVGTNTPLLLLYPISKDSRPEGGSGNREALDALAHVVGLALVFPEPRRLTPQSYKTVDLTRVQEVREEVEYTPEPEVV